MKYIILTALVLWDVAAFAELYLQTTSILVQATLEGLKYISG